jgi:transmembrane sensor
MTSAPQSLADAKTVEVQAVEWLIARDEPGSWTDEKQAAFDTWLAASPAHQTAFWRVEASWIRTELFADLRPYGFGAHRAGPPRKRPWQSSFRIAAVASLLVVAIGAGAALYFREPEMQTFSTPVGGRKILTLLDGSQIELNTNTVVEIGTGENQRHVKLLQGEAFFQVHHDAGHIFMVAAAGHRVTDLGTKFVMRAHGQSLEVTLLEGKASLEPDNGRVGEPLILKPGDVAFANGRSVTLEKRPGRQLDESIAWRKGLLIFDNTSLAEAAAEFNRYNSAKITLSGIDGKLFKLNGAIRVNDREEFSRLARNLFGLKVEQRGNETVIRR